MKPKNELGKKMHQIKKVLSYEKRFTEYLRAELSIQHWI